MKWRIRTVDSEAEKELRKLPSDLKAKFLRVSDLIETFGPIQVGLPHVKFLEDKLWEIRLKGKTGISRSIFVMLTGKEILILNTFIKKTQKIPVKELSLARKRLKRWNND